MLLFAIVYARRRLYCRFIFAMLLMSLAATDAHDYATPRCQIQRYAPQRHTLIFTFR